MSSDQHAHFIIPVKYYIATFIALIILTIFTVASSRVDLGSLNIPLALTIAVTKTLLVGLFFMGLRWERGIILVLFFGSAAAIYFFFILTFSDLGYRDKISLEEGMRFGAQTKVLPVSNQDHDGHSSSSHATEADPSKAASVEANH